MCGIWGYLGQNKRADSEVLSDRIQHRGPDETLKVSRQWDRNMVLDIVFHRLAIVDVINGKQPFVESVGSDRELILAANGEIYNYKSLCAKYNIKTTSDCRVILELYKLFGMVKACQKLEGEFAFVLVDANYLLSDVRVYMGRDRFGIRPLFVTDLRHWAADGGVYFASELKGLPAGMDAHHVSPRSVHLLRFTRNDPPRESVEEYYKLPAPKYMEIAGQDTDWRSRIRMSLVKSVTDRLQSERPLGCLLSGGLDSSLVAGIAARELRKLGRDLHTFSIGITSDSPDITYAREVARHIGSVHHEVIIPAEIWLQSIPAVIRQIETYDTTTVRASTAQFLLGQWISRNTDIKVILNGDGSDEITGGYLYFFNAPDGVSFDDECRRLLSEIHLYDVLRVDRGLCAHGLEARVPFLSQDFVEAYLSSPVVMRAPVRGLQMEKNLLRFSFVGTDYIPDNVLWRKKEAFSDGVSSVEKSWFQIIGENIPDINVGGASDADWRGPIPETLEARYYRHIFDMAYPGRGNVLETARYWLPRWCGSVTNPSARVLDMYNEKKTLE